MLFMMWTYWTFLSLALDPQKFHYRHSCDNNSCHYDRNVPPMTLPTTTLMNSVAEGGCELMHERFLLSPGDS